jgi:DNA-binding response OmpR family regulator
MSGTDALRVLRLDQAFTDTPIVALTAHALDSERVQALAERFDEVVSKPCLPNELVDLIERLLPAAQNAFDEPRGVLMSSVLTPVARFRRAALLVPVLR